jgi:sortase B
MKRKKIKTSALYLVFAIIFIAILAFSGYQALVIYLPQSNESKNFVSLKEESGLKDIKAEDIISGLESSEIPDKSPLSKLAMKNNDFVGWLSIEDTIIDYPVMKSSESDPEFYLHRDFSKNYSYSGTLFIGEGCNCDSDVFVIYGHNMNSGSMFGSLDSYKSGSFALGHKDIVFRTQEENRVYRVFAAFQTKLIPEGEDGFAYYRCVGKLDRGEYNEVLNNIRKMSLISLNDVPKYPEQIMLLSTCYYHTDDGRFVVAAYRVA